MTKRNIMLVLLCLVFQSGFSQSLLRKKHFNTENGLAIQGYDPVAYFTKNKAIKGQKEFSSNVEGVIYYFASSANKSLFDSKPYKYEPQYGGWCAYAMGATNSKVSIDPETFKILNGKLYLFFHNWVNNTLPKWNIDQSNLNSKADKNWNVIFN